ncbi:MAG: PhzF family phenazine biosynthesis protein [Flavobacteriales bacterium]|jgi:PhzF family phenazine biosynthesis protein
MQLKYYLVDAFADLPFQGNPAVVFILERWLPDHIMQAIAAEMNLSETCFAVTKGLAYKIRWFTPTTEVKLCGHATLACAHILYEHHGVTSAFINFQSRSGLLTAAACKYGISLDFPAVAPNPISLTTDIVHAMGATPSEAFACEDLILVYSDASEISILEPNMTELAKLPYRGISATAPGNGNGYDFVCRFFAPASGINEDPVTGSTYTNLAPLYSSKTGKNTFFARQCSTRGGNVRLQVNGDRVHISGKAITVAEATMTLPMSF